MPTEIRSNRKTSSKNNSIKKILFREGKYYSWRSGDLHTDAGVLRVADLKKAGESIKSNINKEFRIFKPTFTDLMFRIKRGPQIITKKDIGFILTETGITKNSVVLDAGTGSGYLAIYLAMHAKKVISYEKREDHLAISRENQETLKVKNLTIKNKDIYEGIDEKDLDVIILDLPEPFRAVNHSFSALKQGGFLVAYLPSIIQVNDFIKEVRKRFLVIKITELLERNWTVEPENNIIRPETQMLGHTAFLCLVRKI